MPGITSVRGGVDRTFRSWSSFTPGQKAVSVAALVALVIGGYFFSRWSATPSYEPLFSNLSTTDASAIVDQLKTSGVTYKITDGGSTILTPKDQVYDLRLKMSGQGLPAGGSSGSSGALGKSGITASDLQQRTDLQRALEGELQDTIAHVDGVQSAIVHLAIPQKDVFADDASKTTASVLLSMAPGTDVTGSQVRAVVHLVASSVENLSPADVTLTDAKGRLLNSPDDTGGGGSQLADDRASMTQVYEDRVSKSIEEMIDKVVGGGHSVVTVTADLNFDKTQSTSETFTAVPSLPPLSQSSSKETMNGSGGTAVGVLGPDNVGVPAAAATPGASSGSSYVKEMDTRNNVMNKVTTQVVQAPGTLRKLNVAVLVDTISGGNWTDAKIRSLVTSAVGVDAKRGDTIEVSKMAFNTTAAAEAKSELSAAAKAQSKAGLMKMVKQAGLGLLTFLVLLMAWLSSRKASKREPLTPAERARLERLSEVAEELDARAPRSALDGAAPAGVRQLPAASTPTPAAEQLTRVRDEIGELVERQPDEVAQLLRGWLADRRT